jgi:hypothetical protein
VAVAHIVHSEPLDPIESWSLEKGYDKEDPFCVRLKLGLVEVEVEVDLDEKSLELRALAAVGFRNRNLKILVKIPYGCDVFHGGLV